MTFSILTDDGFKKFEGVKKKKSNKPIIKIKTDSGKTVRCTEDHDFYDEKNRKIQGQHTLNRLIKTQNGYESVSSVVYTGDKDEYVYDILSVKDTNSYIANGIKVSNCDEFAFVKNDEEFFTSTYPVIAEGKEARITMTSTPNGKSGVFFKTWIKALKGKNDFFSFGVPWYLVPNRDEAWRDKAIANTSYYQFRQEMNIEFLARATSLIDTEVLETMHDDTKKPDDEFEGVRIYEHAQKDQVYVMTVDTAEGKELDSSTFTIFNVTPGTPITQAAVFDSNEIAPIVFAAFIKKWGEEYNECTIVVENNNASGSIVSVTLSQNEYENLYCQGVVNEMDIGVRTTKKTKSTGCAMLKQMCKKQRLIVYDNETYDQLINFESKGTSYEGADGCKDDLVQNLWILGWFSTTDEFEEIVKQNFVDDIYSEELEAIEKFQFPDVAEGVPYSDINGDSESSFW